MHISFLFAIALQNIEEELNYDISIQSRFRDICLDMKDKLSEKTGYMLCTCYKK
jgi:hypothetical protein